MMSAKPVAIGGHTAIGIEVLLPKTTLLAVTTEIGYIMCGALDVALLNDKLRDRGIIAGRAVGVRTLEALLDAPLESVTHGAEQLGIYAGMTGRQAVERMLEQQ
ncbi:YunC family protein [Paenibacillus sp. y28]|uniref:YunC family protein n=1 Tax=Paenibacillus sp. y28 TaxID=3129110 RepID=UPI00301A3DE0